MTWEQIDRLVLLTQRQIQLLKQQLGEGDITTEPATTQPGRPLTVGDTIDMPDGGLYRLLTHDNDSVTLAKINDGRSTRSTWQFDT
jgi:hypothetical protein